MDMLTVIIKTRISINISLRIHRIKRGAFSASFFNIKIPIFLFSEPQYFLSFNSLGLEFHNNALFNQAESFNESLLKC